MASITSMTDSSNNNNSSLGQEIVSFKSTVEVSLVINRIMIIHQELLKVEAKTRSGQPYL